MTDPKPDANPAAKSLRALRKTYRGTVGINITKACTCGHAEEADWHKHKYNCPVHKRGYERERRQKAKENENK